MWVVSPIGQTNSLPPPQKEKKKNALQPFPGDHLPSIPILESFFYRIDFPGRLVSSHSFFNLQLHHPSLTAFVESKREKKEKEAVFSATGPACQLQTHDLTAK